MGRGSGSTGVVEDHCNIGDPRRLRDERLSTLIACSDRRAWHVMPTRFDPSRNPGRRKLAAFQPDVMKDDTIPTPLCLADELQLGGMGEDGLGDESQPGFHELDPPPGRPPCRFRRMNGLGSWPSRASKLIGIDELGTRRHRLEPVVIECRLAGAVDSGNQVHRRSGRHDPRIDLHSPVRRRIGSARRPGGPVSRRPYPGPERVERTFEDTLANGSG